jgi:hypothetical protein
MLHHEMMARIAHQEREQELAHARLARLAACHRACCAPTRLDRLAGRLGLNDCVGGTRS